MKTRFDTLRDYHDKDCSLIVERMDMPFLSITHLQEVSNDITINNASRNFI